MRTMMKRMMKRELLGVLRAVESLSLLHLLCIDLLPSFLSCLSCFLYLRMSSREGGRRGRFLI
jgi:hypothetical protein